MAPSHYRDPTAFGLDLSQQRDLLFGRPLPSPLNATDKLNFPQLSLLLDLQKEVPEDSKINDGRGQHQTGETGRLLSIERRQLILDTVIVAAERVEPTEPVLECQDPKDDKYLALAAAGKADVIVSGDVRDLLSMHPWRGIFILSPSDFLALS